MSGGLAPSKSTVYVSNLPFCLTNNDLHQIFQEFGKIAKVTIVKDKKTRKSSGVAFVLFVTREQADLCVQQQNGKEIMGRTIKCSIAKDNGRASEFITKKTYEDKSFCYECKQEGHLSYACPQNALGEREPPKKKERKRRRPQEEDEEGTNFNDFDSDTEVVTKISKRKETEDEEEEIEESDDETLSAAIRAEQARAEQEKQMTKGATSQTETVVRQRIKPSTYFSDEEELSD